MHKISVSIIPLQVPHKHTHTCGSSVEILQHHRLLHIYSSIVENMGTAKVEHRKRRTYSAYLIKKE